MRIIDLLRMSLGSLWKRKIRTILTILGVVIGTVSVVVMISLGIGMEKTMLEQVEQYSSLTLIEVRENIGGSSIDEKNHLGDEKIKEFKNIDHVETVIPILEFNVLIDSGRYQMNAIIRALSDEGFKKLGLNVDKKLIPKNSNDIELLFGNTVATDWYERKSNSYPYYERGEMAPVDPLKDAMFTIFDTDAYYAQGGSDENGQPIKPPKKHMVKVNGLLNGGIEEWSQYSYYVYMNLDKAKEILKKEFKNKVIPNQPTTEKGKPFKDIYYTIVYVYADDMENVSDIQKKISDMGYEAYASAEWIDSQMKSMKNTQRMFGIIGAVSLVVAAIGIVNTMMMSIYERTKEIGVMKVIGCSMKNIQALFLLEAAYIGFIGGVIGVSLSFGVSKFVNKSFADDTMGLVTTSSIPTWLVVVAIIFATLIGMLSGLIPSIRAMKLSALEAMRT